MHEERQEIKEAVTSLEYIKIGSAPQDKEEKVYLQVISCYRAEKDKFWGARQSTTGADLIEENGKVG